MREATFNTEIMNSLKELDMWAYKIPDFPMSWVMRKTRFTPEKPCDIVTMYRGRIILLELKQMKKWQAFGGQIRDSQKKHMDMVVRKGGRAYVFLNVRIKADKEKNQEYVNRLLFFDWKEWSPIFERGNLFAKELRTMPGLVGKNKLWPLAAWVALMETEIRQKIMMRKTNGRS